MGDEIIKVLDSLCEKFGIVIDWTSSNIIPYLEQLCSKYVNYEITTSVVWIVIGICCLFSSKYMLKRTKYYEKGAEFDEYGNCNSEAAMFLLFAIGFCIALILGISLLITQVFDIVTCLTFPEKIIIEELNNIYRSIGQ